MSRRSIDKEVYIQGKGWYTGKNTWIRCKPNEGGIILSFKGARIPIQEAVVDREEKNFTTSLLIDQEKIFMVEHLFSAISGLEIDDMEIEFGTNDVPFAADSSLFVKALTPAIIEKRGEERDYLCPKQSTLVTDGVRSCHIYPSDRLEIVVNVQFPMPIGEQTFGYVQSPDTYESDVCRARSVLSFSIDEHEHWKNLKVQFPVFPKTFPLDPRNCPFIAYTDKIFLNGLRYENEIARHKVLDFLGDILVLGRPIKARFVLNRPGHAFNAKIVDEILKICHAEETSPRLTLSH